LGSVLAFGATVPVGAGTWSATLSASSGTTVVQGLPFRFDAVVTNSGPNSSKYVYFDLIRDADGATWPFYRVKLSIPSGSSKTVSTSVTTAANFAGLGLFSIVARIDNAVSGGPLAFTVTGPTVLVPTFSNVTQAAGVAATLPDFTCNTWTAGAAWADVNRDGFLDLYLPVRTGPARMWIGDASGTFTDEAAARGLAEAPASHGLGAVFADYDNDGAADLFVTRDDGTRLYHNDGTGFFTDVTAAAGVGVSGVGFQSAAFGDYDADGFLDLYVVRYSDCISTPNSKLGTPSPDNLFHNNGNGTFTDATALVEHDPTTTSDGSTIGFGFQAGWLDYNKDGRIDLYLANANESTTLADSNRMWRNDGLNLNGTWQLTDVTMATSSGYRIASMGLALGDYDRDLDLDIGISNWGATVLARNGGSKFQNVAVAARVDRPRATADLVSVTWGMGFYDLNNDGWEDLYLANGGLRHVSNDFMLHELFVNTRDGKFADLSVPSGAAGPGLGRGVAFADYDRDGRMDIFVVQQNGSPILYHNDTDVSGLHWLEVLPVGTRSNRDGCGAGITATLASGKKLLRQVFCGSQSLGSGSDPAVHFGLGTEPSITSLEIVWPSGVIQTVGGPLADQFITATEP
jgi:hypothetical protein